MKKPTCANCRRLRVELARAHETNAHLRLMMEDKYVQARANSNEVERMRYIESLRTVLKTARDALSEGPEP